MPTYQGTLIERLTPLEAYTRGYLIRAEYLATKVRDDKLKKSGLIPDNIVYVDGIYIGVCQPKETLFEIIERLKIK